MFLCVAYGLYPNIFQISFFQKSKYSRFQKMCLSMDFLNTNYFLASWILQRVCKFQMVLANIPKIQKSFLGIRLYLLLMFG